MTDARRLTAAIVRTKPQYAKGFYNSQATVPSGVERAMLPHKLATVRRDLCARDALRRVLPAALQAPVDADAQGDTGDIGQAGHDPDGSDGQDAASLRLVSAAAGLFHRKVRPVLRTAPVCTEGNARSRAGRGSDRDENTRVAARLALCGQSARERGRSGALCCCAPLARDAEPSPDGLRLVLGVQVRRKAAAVGDGDAGTQDNVRVHVVGGALNLSRMCAYNPALGFQVAIDGAINLPVEKGKKGELSWPVAVAGVLPASSYFATDAAGLLAAHTWFVSNIHAASTLKCPRWQEGIKHVYGVPFLGHRAALLVQVLGISRIEVERGTRTVKQVSPGKTAATEPPLSAWRRLVSHSCLL